MTKILIIEDDEITSLMLSTVLAAESHQIVTARNGSEALELFASFSPELALIDWQLNGPLGGCEVARKLRILSPTLKLAFTSGIPAASIRLECSDTDPIAIFTKPYEYDDVIKLVNEFFGASS